MNLITTYYHCIIRATSDPDSNQQGNAFLFSVKPILLNLIQNSFACDCGQLLRNVGVLMSNEISQLLKFCMLIRVTLYVASCPVRESAGYGGRIQTWLMDVRLLLEF